MKVREVIKRLQQDGWYIARILALMVATAISNIQANLALSLLQVSRVLTYLLVH